MRGHRLRQPGQRRDDAAPPRSGAAARRAQRGAAGAGRHAARPRYRARLARPDQRPPREPARARNRRSTARSTSEARCSSCARRPARVFDTLAQIHLMRGDHEDASRACSKPARPTAKLASRWYQWSVQALEARARAAARGRARGAGRRDANRARGRRARDLCDAGGADRASRRCWLSAGATRRNSGSNAVASGRDAGGRDEQRLGRIPAAARAPACGGRPSDRGVSRLRPERQRVRVCSARGTRPASATWGSGSWRPPRARGRAPPGISPTRWRFSNRSTRAPDLADATPRSTTCLRLPPAATSAFRSTATTRSSGGSSTPPCIPALLATRRDDGAARGVRRAGGGDLHAAATRRGPHGRGGRLRRGDGALDGGGGVAIERRPGLAAAGGRRHRPGRRWCPRWRRSRRRARSRRRRCSGSGRSCAVLRQGFELCSARERPAEPAPARSSDRSSRCCPGFVCASAAMQRVADQIQRLRAAT